MSGTPGATTAEDALKTARMILATEIGKDPLARQEIRDRFKRCALISVTPTDKGMIKIDENHPYYVSISNNPSAHILMCNILRTSNISKINPQLGCYPTRNSFIFSLPNLIT